MSGNGNEKREKGMKKGDIKQKREKTKKDGKKERIYGLQEVQIYLKEDRMGKYLH